MPKFNGLICIQSLTQHVWMLLRGMAAVGLGPTFGWWGLDAGGEKSSKVSERGQGQMKSTSGED